MAWLLGWAVPEAWFSAQAREVFPRDEHVFIAAAPDTIVRLEAVGAVDWVVGYSLGSLLLLREAARVARCGRVALLAPIFAFAREEKSGGRIARAQVEFLARWVRRERREALADFYARSGLNVFGEEPIEASTEDLVWGLETLARERAPAALPEGWRAWCGSEDALLDVAKLREVVPAIEVVAGGTHHPRVLMRAMAEALT